MGRDLLLTNKGSDSLDSVSDSLVGVNKTETSVTIVGEVWVIGRVDGTGLGKVVQTGLEETTVTAERTLGTLSNLTRREDVGILGLEEGKTKNKIGRKRDERLKTKRR